jgi:hypothetical protein
MKLYLTKRLCQLIKMKVAVVGGTGFLGSAVSASLISHSIPLLVISRRGHPSSPATTSDKNNLVQYLNWDVTKPFDEGQAHLLSDITAIIHVVGSLMDSSSYKKWIKSPTTSIQEAMGAASMMAASSVSGDMHQIRQKYQRADTSFDTSNALDKLNRQSCKFHINQRGIYS